MLDALTQPINIRNNMIVDNGAADLGGAITLDDSVERRGSSTTRSPTTSRTGSSENSAIGVPHAAGLARRRTTRCSRRRCPPGAPDFSNPVALFNNIFWNNDAMTLDQFGPGATLVDQGFIDFEVHGTTNNADTLHAALLDLTNGQILGPDGVQHAVPAARATASVVDPLFVTPFILELDGVRLAARPAGGRGDDHRARTRRSGSTGDYHLQHDLAARSTAACAAPTRRSRRRRTRCACTPGRGIGAPTGLPSATNATAAATTTASTGRSCGRCRRPDPVGSRRGRAAGRAGDAARRCHRHRESLTSASEEVSAWTIARRHQGPDQLAQPPDFLKAAGVGALGTVVAGGVVGALGRGCCVPASAATTVALARRHRRLRHGARAGRTTRSTSSGSSRSTPTPAVSQLVRDRTRDTPRRPRRLSTSCRTTTSRSR